MKKKIHVLVFFLIMMTCLCLITTNQAFAENDYSLEIKPISFSVQPNVLTRNMAGTTAMEQKNHENVQVSKTCYTGETFSLTAIIVPSNAYVGEVVWSIEQDYEVAKIVSENGLSVSIVGVKAGNCTIVCTAADGQGAYTTCQLTVFQHAEKIELNFTDLLLEPGDTQQLVATVLPQDTSDKTVIWISSDETIATVDENGVVSAHTPSNKPITITAQVIDGSNVTATVNVNVRVLVKEIKWKSEPTKIYIKGDTVEKFETIVSPVNATISTLKYTSSDLNIATVMADKTNNNCVLVTPKNSGKFTLTCEATDGSGVKLSTEIEVIQLVEHIALNTTEKVLFLQDGNTVTYQLIATTLPSSANNKNVTWVSGDDTIASVSSAGLITAKKPGSVSITVSATDEGGASATCIVHVRKPISMATIDLYSFEYLQGTNVELKEKLQYLNGFAYVYSGDEVALRAEFNDDATLKELIWQVSGKGTTSSGEEILGIYATIADPRSNPAIMTARPINSANKEGYLNITITCKANDGSGFTAQRVVQIRQPATSVNLDQNSLTLYTEESKMGNTSAKLVPTILPINAYVNQNPDSFGGQPVRWESSNPSVATVDKNGVVNAISAGEAVITARSADGHGEVARCSVTVLQAVTNLSANSYYGDQLVLLENGCNIYAHKNQNIRLHVNIAPQNASNQKLTWSSSRTDIVTVEAGYLKIGNTATAIIDEKGNVVGESVLISCATTDGSGKLLKFNLYVLETEYNVEVDEFISVAVGDTEKLLLKIYQSQSVNNQIVSVPINADVLVSIKGNNSKEIMQIFDENGNEIKNAQTLKDVSNPSFDIKGVYDGIVTVTFKVELSSSGSQFSNKNLIGTPISLEKDCTINVTGSEHKKISISQESISLLVGQTKQLTAVVTPASATNYYIKYSLVQYDKNYENPYQYARIDEDTGVINGLSIGMVKAVATLYDATTDEVVMYNGTAEKAEIPVYITAALTGVTMDNATVYVGDSLNLLDCVHLYPDSLHQSIKDKSTLIKFNVLSGDSYIRFSSKQSGVIEGITTGTVRIEAIATYNDAVYTSNIVDIYVKEKLTDISLVDKYTIKRDAVLMLTPIKTPLWGDMSSAEVIWKSSNPNVVSVELSAADGFSGIITGLTNGTSSVSVTVKVGGSKFTKSTTIEVLPISINDISNDTGKSYELKGSNGLKAYYKYGPYHVEDAKGIVYASDCLENGAFSLGVVKLERSGETNKYKHNGKTYLYPNEFPLKTFLALERVEELMKLTAQAAGYMSNDKDNAGFNVFMDELNTAIIMATYAADTPDENAYLDLPNKSHIWTLVGNEYKADASKGGFDHWGHTSSKTVNIFKGLSTMWDNYNGTTLPSAEDVIQKVSPSFTETNMNDEYEKLLGSYMTSPMTAINVVSGSTEIALRQANALSILHTYFPIDEMFEGNINLDKNSEEADMYARVHAARQMLTWTISGVNISEEYYNKLSKNENIQDRMDYLFLQKKYTGDNMYYACLMIQAEPKVGDPAPNYMVYPHGYSEFYYTCTKVLGGTRFKQLDKLMPIVEGFVWKLDQAKNQAIPSFASRDAETASQPDNLIQLYYDSSTNSYTARVNDTNGVLNYYNFESELTDKDGVKHRISCKNKGDGTLEISVPKATADKIKSGELPRIQHATPEFLPPDCKYRVAAFVKHELETEICQLPYTKKDGSLGYAYLMGANAQSQIFTTSDMESSLGDPFSAYINFAFNDLSEYDSKVVCDIKLYNLAGQEVEYIIPNEQYQLKYIYTYIGDSRGLKIVNKNKDQNMEISQDMYGFAADMRARTELADSLLAISAVSANNNKLYTVSKTSTTIEKPVWALQATEVPVKITGKYTVYNTPAGTSSSWNSGSLWNDTIQIDANVGKNEIASTDAMEESSDHKANVNVRKENGEVIIEWSFYTGYITFTTPYVKAEADIVVDADSKYTVNTKANVGLTDDKYVYGLTINGVQAVTGTVGTNNSSITKYSDYVANYDFTGMINNVVNLADTGEKIPDYLLPTALFDGLAYYYTDNQTNPPKTYLLSDIEQIEQLPKKGAAIQTSPHMNPQVGDVWFFSGGTEIKALVIYIDNDFAVYWEEATQEFHSAKYADAISKFSTKFGRGGYNFEHLTIHNIDGNEALRDEASTATYNPKGEGMNTSFTDGASKTKDLWDDVEHHLKEFTMTNPLTYGGSGYFSLSTEPIYANNACNYTDFHTDKTFMTVFDFSISNLVVNTGAGITSPTSIDTRNFVNLNIYYTINLTNDAYKIIANRYGQIGNVWWQYYKDTDVNGNVDKAETEYVYKRTDFFYEKDGKAVYCTANEVAKENVTYYYDPTHKGKDKSWPDKMSQNSKTKGDFIPDDREAICLNSFAVPAGYAEEKELDIVIHSDVFTDFCIYDNKNITNNKLNSSTFATLTPEQQLEELKKVDENEIIPFTFLDNVQTGENYVQHSLPYFLTSTESGIKAFGFSAHVNMLYGTANCVEVDVGSGEKVKVYVDKAMAEWGGYAEEDQSRWFDTNKPTFHWVYETPLDSVARDETSLLGHKVTYLNRDLAFGESVSVGNGKYKYYYYPAEYGWSYDNNETATGMLQYPSYNPYTLSTVSTNGSLVYKNAAGIKGFDITLGNNQMIHIPNIDAIRYMLYLRSFGDEDKNNAGQINGSYGVQYTNGGTSFLQTIKNPNTIKLDNPHNLTDFTYQSLNFYKYSDSNYKLYQAGGVNATPNKTLTVQSAPAKTEVVNDTQTESYKLTKILFRSTYTVSRKLGDNGWVDVTTGSNPDALVNAGKGFELKIEVTYTNNNLTDYLVRYLKDSAQNTKNLSSADSSVTSAGCNISALTGQYGIKNQKDPYTHKVASGKLYNDVFGANVYKDIYVVMNNNNKYVYSYSGVYGSTQVFDMSCKYQYDEPSKDGTIVLTYTMKLSPVNGFFGNVGGVDNPAGLATQSMKFYTDSSAAGTVGSLTIWTNPIAATPFGYPSNMRDRYLADIAQIQYYITQPVDNVDNIVQ